MRLFYECYKLSNSTRSVLQFGVALLLLTLAGQAPAVAQLQGRIGVTAAYEPVISEPGLFNWPTGRSQPPDAFFASSGFRLGATYHYELDRPWMDILISAQYSQFSVEEDRIVERLVACEVNCQVQNTLSLSPLREFNIMIGVGATPYRAQLFSPFLDVEAGVAVTNSSRSGQLRYTEEGLPRTFNANEIILDEDAGTLVGVATEVEAGVQVRFLPQTVARIGVSHSLLRAYGNTMQTYGLVLTLMQSFE